MTKINNLAVLCRFPMSHLCVEPCLLGKSHKFKFENFNIILSLPAKNEVTKFKVSQEHRITYHQWDEINGKEKPTCYWVGEIDIKTDIEEEGKAEDAEEIALKSLDIWLRTLRWKSLNCKIGRVNFNNNPYTIGKNCIIERKSGKYVSSIGHRGRLEKAFLTTKKIWTATQKALEVEGLPPIWYDLFSDAVESYRLNDYRKMVIDCAVSCELLLHDLFEKSLPRSMRNKTKMLKHFEKMNITQLRSDHIRELLPTTEHEKYDDLNKVLKELFEARNSLLHKGSTSQKRSREQYKKFLEATWNLIAFRTSYPVSPLNILDSGRTFKISIASSSRGS
ncbi:MAG: hypothetical protein ACRCYY_03300 [Trueperaceae bacterium]